MTYNPSSRLTKIELSGFQVFEEAESIAIAPVTLVFGPNSVGKSSIEDSLRLLENFWRAETAGQADDNWNFCAGSNRERTLARDWRKVSGGGHANRPMTISATVECWNYELFPPDLMTKKYIPFDLLNAPRRNAMLQASIEFSPPISTCGLRIEVNLDEIPLYIFVEGRVVSFNNNHPAFFGKGISIANSGERVDGESAILLDEAGWLSLRAPVTLDSQKRFDWFSVGKQVFPNATGPSNPNTWYGSLAAFSEFHNLAVNQISQAIASACKYRTVSASRAVPTDQQLTFFLDKNLKVADPSQYSFSLPSDPQYQSIVRSAALSSIKKLNEVELTEEDSLDIEVHKEVNRLLADHLVTDRGYRIEADITKLQPLQWGNDAMKEDHAWLAKLRICDTSNRRHSFTEVGSGFGYTLPVLSALVSSDRCYLQQPELHLHPALQAPLADVFVEFARHGKYILVETHSEHILLRLLKRIRQSSKDRPVSEDLRISPNEIAILYFEPTSTDVTKVRRLRVTEDGDFLDYWPKGFFMERDAELFDE